MATFVAIYVVYDSLKVTRSVVLGEEVLSFASADEVEIAELKKINEDIIGWIRVDDTDINYPILQSIDNEYYLARNYRREFATAGSIFLDYRNDLSDDFLIIYGHRMSYGGMLTDIIKFRDAEFFESHKTGTVYFGEERLPFTIVAFGVIRSDSRMIYDFGKDAKNEVLRRATYRRNEAAGRYILLSTCDAHNKEMRDVLLARIAEQ